MGFVSPGHLAWSRGLPASQSAHHFMYISLDYGHLSPGHDTSQYTLHHTLSPAPYYLQFCLEKLGDRKETEHSEERSGRSLMY